MQAGDFFGNNIANLHPGGDLLPGFQGPPRPYRADGWVEIVGLPQLIAKLAVLPGRAKQALGQSMLVEMLGIIDLAKDKYVPIDSGQLRDTGRARGPIFSATSVEVWGSFGPATNPRGSHYAIPVHEIPEPPATSVGGRSAHHEHGSWKYLQIPLLERQAGMLDRLADWTNHLRL